MENSKVETSNKNGKAEIEEKLKLAIINFFNQLKTGCFRKNCYNPYCKKGDGN